jgi:hypothetical protein
MKLWHRTLPALDNADDARLPRGTNTARPLLDRQCFIRQPLPMAINIRALRAPNGAQTAKRRTRLFSPLIDNIARKN